MSVGEDRNGFVVTVLSTFARLGLDSWNETAELVTQRRSIAILTYPFSAEKPDVPIYKALCALSYLNDDNKRLRISHQHTAVT